MSGRASHLRRTIFAQCRELGLDDDARHDVQRAVTGRTSLKEMDEAELSRLSEALAERGARPRRHREADPRADQRLIWVLWRLLAEKGVVTPGGRALRAFVSNPKFAAKWGEPVTDTRFLTVERARDVIEALKDMARRHGVEVER